MSYEEEYMGAFSRLSFEEWNPNHMDEKLTELLNHHFWDIALEK